MNVEVLLLIGPASYRSPLLASHWFLLRISNVRPKRTKVFMWYSSYPGITIVLVYLVHFLLLMFTSYISWYIHNCGPLYHIEGLLLDVESNMMSLRNVAPHIRSTEVPPNECIPSVSFLDISFRIKTSVIAYEYWSFCCRQSHAITLVGYE